MTHNCSKDLDSVPNQCPYWGVSVVSCFQNLGILLIPLPWYVFRILVALLIRWGDFDRLSASMMKQIRYACSNGELTRPFRWYVPVPDALCRWWVSLLKGDSPSLASSMPGYPTDIFVHNSLLDVIFPLVCARTGVKFHSTIFDNKLLVMGCCMGYFNPVFSERPRTHWVQHPFLVDLSVQHLPAILSVLCRQQCDLVLDWSSRGLSTKLLSFYPASLNFVTEPGSITGMSSTTTCVAFGSLPRLPKMLRREA